MQSEIVLRRHSDRQLNFLCGTHLLSLFLDISLMAAQPFCRAFFSSPRQTPRRLPFPTYRLEMILSERLVVGL
jgi:hypothetical protein